MSENPVLNSIFPLLMDPEHVTINEDCLEDVGVAWAKKEFSIPDWTFEPHPGKNMETIIDFFMIANALNFAYKEFKPGGQKFTATVHDKEFRGSLGLWACLNQAYEKGQPILDGDYLANLSREDAENIFRGNIEIPMLDERVQILNKIGAHLTKFYDGHFHNFVEKYKTHLFDEGEGLVERLVKEFPSYEDTYPHNADDKDGFAIFWKRAQLTVGMLRGRLGEGYFPEAEIPQLTVYADYQLPRVLRGLGILEYSRSLAEKVDNEIPIFAGSKEELEIRASTIWAAQDLVGDINFYRDDASLSPITNVHMDAHLFLQGRKMKNLKPHHLCETTAY